MGANIRLLQVEGGLKPPAGAFLIEAKWPRGWARAALAGGHWLPRVMPTAELVTWMRFQPLRWATFCEVYWADLAANPLRWQPLLRAMQQGELVLMHEESTPEHSPLQALVQFLQARYQEWEQTRDESRALPVCYASQFETT